jgi:hypothetical protein
MTLGFQETSAPSRLLTLGLGRALFVRDRAVRADDRGGTRQRRGAELPVAERDRSKSALYGVRTLSIP